MPVICDNVIIGGRGTILGPVVVGEGTHIAPTAHIIEDVPPRSFVSGNPAVIRKKPGQ